MNDKALGAKKDPADVTLQGLFSIWVLPMGFARNHNLNIVYLFLITACAERYSGRTFWTTAPYPSNRLAYDPNDNFPPFLTLHIGFQEAEKYRKQSGSYLRKNQWEDLTIDVYL